MTTTRDQERALHAYDSVRKVQKDQRKDYKILVNDLGSQILRSGLAATLAFIKRDKDADVQKLLIEHLAAAKIPGLKNARTFYDDALNLPTPDYMLATRELLKVIAWFKRAVQAEFPKDL
jgi:CRISPR-associated protein Cmr5